MIFTTDDVYPSTLKYFEYWKRVRACIPNMKLYCFVIAFKDEDPNERVDQNDQFMKWYEDNKDWIEVGVHGYDHALHRTQEGWRTDQKEYIEKSVEILKDFLPDRYLYRPPGFRFLPKTEKILKEIGFGGIAHQEFIKYFDTCEFKGPVLNTHCCPDFDNPITDVWKNIIGDFANG